MPHVTGYAVYAPGATMWWHERLVWWAAWLRQRGYRGWLPAWATRHCAAYYPGDVTCACGLYRINWRDLRYASQETDQDGEESR